MQSINDLVNKIIPIAIEEYKKQVTLQNFVNKGKLRDDITAETILNFSGYIINFFIKDYGVFLDKGISPNNVPYSPGSGRAKSKYIAGLQKWVKSKLRKRNKEALSIAFAIAKIHKKQGIASVNSKEFSKNGKRAGFIDDTLEELNKVLEKYITEELSTFIIEYNLF